MKGRILIAKDRATELLAGAVQISHGLTLDPEAELLAHERGWIWAIYYTQGKARTHFALIHSMEPRSPVRLRKKSSLPTANAEAGLRNSYA